MQQTILAQSADYYVKASYETAELYAKDGDRRVACVGEHYGDVADCIIDRDERFCVTVGCGYIVYFIKPPFEDYASGKATAQWFESGREKGSTVWYTSVRQISAQQIELTDENGKCHTVNVKF